MSEYTEQAENFLKKHNLTFRAVFVGEDCPQWCEDAKKGNLLVPGTFPRKNHIHGSHWRLTLSREGKGHFTVDFWDSYADAKIRSLGTQAYRRGESTPFDELADQQPTAYDMLAAVTKSEPGTFEDFCSDFGYDEDSRSAERVYQAVVKEYRMVSTFFTADELAEAQEIN